MGKKKADAEVDLPYDPKSRSHFVNFEVLKRLSAPRLGGSPDAYKLFDDDAPYDKYIENPPTEDVRSVLPPRPGVARFELRLWYRRCSTRGKTLMTGGREPYTTNCGESCRWIT
jgi:hypothetical protein